MRARDVLVVICLLVSFSIYLLYRTEKTVINEIFITVFTYENFVRLRTCAPYLNEHIIYSLPEGLWVFCITLTSKFLFVSSGHRNVHLLIVPLVFSIGLELCQLLHITNGRFDFWDMGFSVFFWTVANYLVKEGKMQHVFKPFTLRSFTCLISYLIVFLAHVWTNR